MNEQVERLLGGEALRPLVRKLDRRLAKDPEVRGRISLTNPSPATREAITALLGVPPKPTGAIHVNLELLDKVIRQSGAGDGLADAIAQLLDRQPQHPAIEGRKQKLAWREAYRDVEPSPSWSPAVDEFLRRICRNGALRRASRNSLENAKLMLRQLSHCLVALPLNEPTPLPVFAAQCLGDAHALDADRPLSSLLLQAIHKTFEGPASVKDNQRAIWSRVNIVLDELSSTVLVLNLACQGDSLLDRTLAAHAALGEPCRLTYRQLRLHELHLALSPATVFVCENPSILSAAASSLADRCQPLACIEGQPSHAAANLLGRLQRAGVALRYHGDFDRSGLQIAAQMIARFAATPWRMSSADYVAELDHASLAFDGEVPPTSWDPALQAAIRTHQKVVLEESCLGHLLADLSG